MAENDKNKKILIVEDEIIIAMDIMHTLKSFGFSSYSVADNAEKALEMIASDMPDLVLMDISLSGDMDGIEATRFINEKFSSVPVVYITSYSNPAIRKRAEETKYLDYVLKPFSAGTLNTVITKAFS